MKANDKLTFALKIAMAVVAIAYALNFAYAIYTDQGGGTFGDTFGASNSAFSGVALMMLIYAVILQREELALIKEERDDTRKLLEGQERITALQEQALRKQIFEQSFNALLKMAVDEKSRLSIVEQTGSNVYSSQLSRAANSALVMLRLEAFSLQSDYNVLQIERIDYLLKILIHLDVFVGSSKLDESIATRLKSLISGLID